MSDLNVLWLTQSYPSPMDPAGGIFHKTQAEALARTGVRIELAAPVPAFPSWLAPYFPKWSGYRQIPPESREGGVRILRPRYPALPQQSKWASPHIVMGRRIEALRLDKPDLVHAHFAYPQGLIGLRMARQWNVPLVVTLHGCDVNTYPDYNAAAMRRFVKVAVEADELLAVSGALGERARELSGREARVLPIGINLAAYRHKPDKAEARALLGLPQDEFLVLYVGALLETKGVRELLRGLESLDPAMRVSGVFVGGGPLAAEVKSSPRARAEGVQPNDRVPLYMAAADVLVLPSYKEGLPTVLVEAGAAGIPVIATGVGGIPELLGGDRGRMVAAKSPDVLRAAIEETLRSPEEAAARAERLQAYVRSHYDAERNASALKKRYESVLASAKRPSDSGQKIGVLL